ncbi:hypothetical protein H9L25_03325 [Terrisporobacter mayombei]|nr:hypothetical protein [Terrisporobacter mayombei]
MNLNRNEDFRSIIAQAIKDAYTEDIRELKDNYELKTFSSRHALAKDLLNTYVFKRLEKNRFIIEKFNRGAHEFISIYDKKEKSLYSLMKMKTFKGLEKSKKKKNVHYLESLGLLNNNTIPKESQIEFFEDKYRQNLMEELLLKIVSKEVVDEVEVHKLITFDIKNNDLTSISVFQLNSQLDIIDEESWNEYIGVDYDDIGTRESNMDTTKEGYALEEEIPLGIKGTDIQIKVK